MIETVLGRISSISRRATRASWLTPVASRMSSACLAAEQTVVNLAVVGGDGDRLEAAHEADAGKDDGLHEVAFGADRADLGEVGADVSPAVADGVAGEASRLFTVEDKLAPADVAGGERRHELLQSDLLLGRVHVELGVECLGLFWTAGLYFARWALTASTLKLDNADDSARALTSFRPSASSVDCSKAASKRSTSTGPADRNASASRESCSGVSFARARTSAAVVRVATV